LDVEDNDEDDDEVDGLQHGEVFFGDRSQLVFADAVLERLKITVNTALNAVCCTECGLLLMHDGWDRHAQRYHRIHATADDAVHVAQSLIDTRDLRRDLAVGEPIQGVRVLDGFVCACGFVTSSTKQMKKHAKHAGAGSTRAVLQRPQASAALFKVTF
jgi:hypothetical protein